MVHTIVSDIEKRPEEYKPAIVDGFYINRDGNDLLLMKREGALSTDTSRKKISVSQSLFRLRYCCVS